MLKGIPVDMAEKEIEAGRVHRREMIERWKQRYNATIGRFVVQPIMVAVRFVAKMFRDAHTMWQTLNESCPYWMEPRQLDRNDR